MGAHTGSIWTRDRKSGGRPSPAFGKVAAVAGLLVLIIALGATGVATLESDDLGGGPEPIKLADETFVENGLDDLVDVDNNQIFEQPNPKQSAGTIPPGIESFSVFPDARTSLTKNNYVYSFEVKEQQPDSWQIGDDFQVRVWGWNGVSPTLLGTVYVKQSLVQDTEIEGVNVLIDSGSTDPYAYVWSIVISRQ